ncbi:hypothetical protein tb265_46230 [Gemmatimonadetes bacterium T265]|nr:hypothetical protein tb265_46230 [Gemmatimonadetes bacterium T265]
MPATRGGLIGRAAQALGAVLPDGFEQGVAGLAAVRGPVRLAHLDERVLDEAAERVEHGQGAGERVGRARPRPHELDRVEREAAAEHREAREQRLRRGVEQAVAPVEHRAERLVARQGGAPPAREQAERVAQALRHALHA